MLDADALEAAMEGQDIVYANLAGQLDLAPFSRHDVTWLESMNGSLSL